MLYHCTLSKTADTGAASSLFKFLFIVDSTKVLAVYFKGFSVLKYILSMCVYIFTFPLLLVTIDEISGFIRK